MTYLDDYAGSNIPAMKVPSVNTNQLVYYDQQNRSLRIVAMG